MLEKLESLGETPTFYRAIVLAVVAGLVNVDDLPDKPTEKLTEREQEILLLRLEGLRTQEIREKLVISQKTLKNHFTEIKRKLGVNNQFALVAAAAKLASMVARRSNDGGTLSQIPAAKVV